VLEAASCEGDTGSIDDRDRRLASLVLYACGAQDFASCSPRTIPAARLDSDLAVALFEFRGQLCEGLALADTIGCDFRHISAGELGPPTLHVAHLLALFGREHIPRFQGFDERALKKRPYIPNGNRVLFPSRNR
jgi:hypothetical protein